MSDVALRFGATDDGLTAKFRQVNKQLDDFEKSANKTAGLVSTGFKALGGIIGAVSVVRLTNEMFDYAESLEVASARTGIAIENLQRLQFIASQSDVAVDSVTAAINRLQKELVAGGKESADAIRGIGLSVEELRNLGPDEQFLKVAAAIAEIPDPAERSAAAMQIFGRGGAELLPILAKGADGVRELSAKFDELGFSVSNEAVERVDDLGDSFGRLGFTAKGLGVELLSLVATPFEKLADGFTLLLNSIWYGLTGGDEAEKLNNRILELQGRVALFEKDRSDSGRERLKQAREELAILREQQDIARGFGLAGIQPRLQSFRNIDVPMPQGNFGIEMGPRGPREPTAAERRAKADEGRPEVDIKIDENKTLEDLNQRHLDELLRQTTDYVTEKVRIESEAEQFLADVRETFGLQQIEFEQIKNASIVQIGSMLFTSLAAQNSKLAKIQQGIAIAETVWATATGIAKAVASFNYGAAVKIAAVGAIQLAKIKATNYSASGSVSGSAPTVAGGDSIGNRDTTDADQGLVDRGATQRPQANITINATGWSREAIQSLVDAAKDAFDQYDITLFGANSLQAQIIREG